MEDQERRKSEQAAFDLSGRLNEIEKNIHRRFDGILARLAEIEGHVRPLDTRLDPVIESTRRSPWTPVYLIAWSAACVLIGVLLS